MHRFPVFDLLRGVAAFAVVCFHNEILFGGVQLHHAYLAVDFFFMLSGFVLATAYQRRLDEGWATGAFLKVRIIRLFPLYLLALAMSLVHHARIDRTPLSWHTFGLPAVLSLAMLPPTPWTRRGLAYTFNTPCWSIAIELVVNVFHAVLLRNRSSRSLVSIAGVMGVVMAYASWHYGTISLGADLNQLLWGIPRAIVSYVLGMLLYRAWQRRTFAWSAPTIVVVPVFLVVLAGPTLGRLDIVYDLVVILVVFPALLMVGANAVVSERERRLADVFGRSSYAVYALHFPIALWWPIVLHLTHLDRLDRDVPLNGILYLLFTFAVAVVLDRVYDEPVRRFLQERTKRTQAAARA